MWTWKTHVILYLPTRCMGTPRRFTWTYALSSALRKHVVCVWALMARVFAAFDSVSLSLNLSGFRCSPSFELLLSVSWCKTLWVSFDNGTGEEPPCSSKKNTHYQVKCWSLVFAQCNPLSKHVETSMHDLALLEYRAWIKVYPFMV